MKLFFLLLIITASRCSENRTEDTTESEEEPSLVGIFSGLLETLTETASSSSCPGQCVHTIRAFMCEHVLDGPHCPGNLKCCTEQQPPPKNITNFQGPPPNGQRPMGRPGEQGFWNGNNNNGFRPPPGYRPPPYGQYRPPPDGYRPSPQQMNPPRIQEVMPVPVQPLEIVTPQQQHEDPPSTSPPPIEIPLTSQPLIQVITQPPTTATTTTSTRAPAAAVPQAPQGQYPGANVSCPGVCVSTRMSSSCEAVYKVPFACRNDLKCCVILDNYTADRSNLIIRDEEEDDSMVEDDEEEEKLPERPATPPRIEPKRPLTQQREPEHPLRIDVDQNQDDSKEQSYHPARDSCPGTCISSFFTFFCEQVLDFDCPNEGKCCMNQEKEEERPQQPPPPPVQQKPQSQHCPRVCLPTHLYNACPRALPFECAQGYFCCIGPPMTQQPPPNFKPTPEHNPQVPQKPNKQKTQRVRTTTTTTTTTESPEELYRPPCPGSCINNILTFTCFRNAEITELFTCNKAGTKCCAPKTAIREHLEFINGTEEKVGEETIGQTHPQGQMVPLPPPSLHQPHIMQHPPPEHPAHNPIPPAHQINVPPSIHQNTKLIPAPQNHAITPPLLNPPIGPPVILPQAKIQNSRSNYVCGVKQGIPPARVKRVVGGSDSYPGEWCWQVALINSLNQYLCGAALIGTQWILTAAHCVTNIVRTGSTIYVRVGDHDLTSKYGSPSAQTLRVATTYIHHNHNSQTLDNDIALLKLQGQVDLRDGVCLVCLPARGEGVRSGRRCTVTGYGYMGEAGPIPLRIREATLPIIADHDCVRKVNAVTEKTFVLPASSFCAGGEASNDACQGDGGGPLVCQDEGYYELTGLVSWGFGCGREDVPGVYVKVSSFIGWINQIISVNN